MSFEFGFDYDENVYRTPRLYNAPVEVLSEIKRLRSKLHDVEKSLKSGDAFTAWFSETDPLVSALLMSNWVSASFEIPEYMSQLYFPDSNLIKFSKGNLILILGLMRMETPDRYAPALTIIAA